MFGILDVRDVEPVKNTLTLCCNIYFGLEMPFKSDMKGRRKKT